MSRKSLTIGALVVAVVIAVGYFLLRPSEPHGPDALALPEGVDQIHVDKLGRIHVIEAKRGSSARPTVAIYNLLSHPILNASADGIKAGLAKGGYGEGRVRLIELNANGEMDKLNAFAIELLAVDPDVIIPISTPVTQAVFKEASADQLIVFSTVTNPSDVGMDDRPDNMTGVCDAVNYQANFDLIFELFPATKTIGIIYNAGERNSQFGVDRFRKLARSRSIDLKLLTVSKSIEVVDAARALAENVDVLYVGSDNTVVAAMAGLTKVAYDAGTPVIASDSGSVEGGALAAVSVDYRALGNRTGRIVAEVLKSGRLPEDRSPVIFHGDVLLLNDKAAGQLGFTFPQATRKRAKRVIR